MSDFEWPWEYNFPPFFTLQPHAETRDQQISVWSNLLLKYHKHRNLSFLDINEDSELFHNQSINRNLSNDGRLAVLESLLKKGHASATDKRRVQWEIYWHTLDEWANIIYNWASETGQINTVCTIHEISNGDNSADQEFYQLDQDIVVKALRQLEDKGRCEIISFDDNRGVKFF